ncbi:hypothetical protein ACQKP0_08640 [Heyndrickxia sp. NPDC080065]
MSREYQLKLSDFVKNDRFELTHYLAYLFHQFYDHSADKKTIINESVK